MPPADTVESVSGSFKRPEMVLAQLAVTQHGHTCGSYRTQQHLHGHGLTLHSRQGASRGHGGHNGNQG